MVAGSRLLNPVPCVIERIDRTNTVYDFDAREPVQAASRITAVTLQGQVRFLSQQDLQPFQQGPSEQSFCSVVFLRADLARSGFTIELNDRITIIGNITQEVYVTRLQPFGHLSELNACAFMKAWCTDRLPAKERP